MHVAAADNHSRGRYRVRGRPVVNVIVPRRRGGPRQVTEDRVRRHDAPSPRLQGGELGPRAVPVPAVGGHDARASRGPGQPHAHLRQRVHAVQRVHGPGQGRERPRARHLFARLQQKRHQAPAHD